MSVQHSAQAKHAAQALPRLVLDTNVCLDLFVFDDPGVAHLRAALQGGIVVAVTNTECRDEWLRVLDYDRLGLDVVRREAALVAYDATVGMLIPEPMASLGQGADRDTPESTLPRLPRCADPDDQKFLQLAHGSGARWLISRDDAVLALKRRCARDGLFAILPPDAWTAALIEG